MPFSGSSCTYWFFAISLLTSEFGSSRSPKKRMRLFKPLLGRYPAVYEALNKRYLWYNETLEYIDSRVAAGKAVLIAPEEPLEISRICHDPDVMQRVYDIGRKAGEAYCSQSVDRSR